jgi:hypothetical protein
MGECRGGQEPESDRWPTALAVMGCCSFASHAGPGASGIATDVPESDRDDDGLVGVMGKLISR